MIADNPTLGTYRPVAPHVTTLAGPHEVDNALVYLTVQDGSDIPGLYLRSSGEWANIQDAATVV